MAITDIQISEELQTGAPSIKYRGNEGPKAPMQMAAGEDPLLVEEYQKYVFDMEEQGLTPMSFEEFKRQAIAGYAYGGVAGLDGRRRYGIGSKLKRTVRKLIPNEVARVAEVAAPIAAMVAPQFALPAALAAGLGKFDRTGSISSGLKSGALTYGLGALSPGMERFKNVSATNPFTGKTFTQPFGGQYNISNLFKGKGTSMDASEVLGKRMGDTTAREAGALKSLGIEGADPVAKANLSLMENIQKEGLVKGVLKNIGEAKLSTQAMLGILGVSGAAGLYTAMTQPQEQLETLDRGVGLPGGISAIRTEVIEAMKDPSGEKLKAIRIKYPFLGAQETKNIDIMAEGGRAGYYAGGQSIPSEYTMEDARKTAMQDRLGGITEVMKQADLYRQGDIGQMYMAEGGSTQEAGIMDLDGMEKDYRETGGFVDLGAEEKADDVPARLSVNEFVMTADAVRGAGDGDIDLGAERMEDLMEKLEAKNKRQQGASDMFEVSERLSAVV